VGANRALARRRARRGDRLIVLLHGARAFGAVERYVASIARALGDGCVLVHPGVDAFERLGVRTIVTDRPTVRQLRTVLRGLRPRVAHVTDVWPQAIVAARLARVPRVLVTHHTPELPRRDNAAGRAWLRLGWLLRPEVVYTSESDRAVDGRTPSHVVSLGIDVERFASGAPVLERSGPLVVDVARLASQKEHGTLLRAIALVRRRHADTRLVLVGDGELRRDLELLAGDLGLGDAVLFAGERDDVPDILASCDVFAHPASFEGFCLAVVEAQAAGVPVVATPVGGVRETVVDGVTGLLVPVGDVDALAAAIGRLLDDRALGQRLAADARRQAGERYADTRMIEETLRLYDSAPASSSKITSSDLDTSQPG
jgi:glycosyltransferase involved in cell wall biosynthesis